MARRKTHEEFIDDVKKAVGNEYRVVGTYTLSKDPVEIEHIECGESWSIKPNNFMNGKRCPNCARKNSYKTTEDYKTQVVNLTLSKLEVVDEYKGSGTRIKHRCTVHDEEISATPTDVLRGRTVCKSCNAEYLSRVQRKPQNVFNSELEAKHEGTVESVGTYLGNHIGTKLHCNKCNNDFTTTPHAILRYSGCPVCAEPKGEAQIRKYLEEREIVFEVEKSFKDCRDVRPLLFDFYVPEFNALIEYDGKQHYEPIEFFGGDRAFKSQTRRDRIKNDFANLRGIQLIRIPYTVTGNNINKELDIHLRSSKPTISLS